MTPGFTWWTSTSWSSSVAILAQVSPRSLGMAHFLMLLASLWLSLVCGPAAGSYAGQQQPFFMRGAAMSLLPTLDCNGTCSRYRANSSASPQDALQILADHGLNTDDSSAQVRCRTARATQRLDERRVEVVGRHHAPLMPSARGTRHARRLKLQMKQPPTRRCWQWPAARSEQG